GCTRSGSGSNTPAAASGSTSAAPTLRICRPPWSASAVRAGLAQDGRAATARHTGDSSSPGIDSVPMTQLSSPESGSPDTSFVHLHVHTEYSMLDGAARIDELFATAAQMGMPALATTDHGYVFGAYEFWSKAKKYGIKPIIGVEAYLTPGTHRTDKTRVTFGDGGRDDVSGSGAYTHMTLLARSTEGMHNLFRMSSL